MHSIGMNKRSSSAAGLIARAKLPAYVPCGWIPWAVIIGFAFCLVGMAISGLSCDVADRDRVRVDGWHDTDNVSFTQDGNP